MTMDMSSLMIDSEKNEPSIADLQVHGDCTGIIMYDVCTKCIHTKHVVNIHVDHMTL